MPEKNTNKKIKNAKENSADFGALKKEVALRVRTTWRPTASPHVIDLKERFASPAASIMQTLKAQETSKSTFWRRLGRGFVSVFSLKLALKVIFFPFLALARVVFGLGDYVYRAFAFVGRKITYLPTIFFRREVLLKKTNKRAPWWLKEVRLFEFKNPLKFLFNPAPRIYWWEQLKAVGIFAAIAFLVIMPIKAMTYYAELSEKKKEIITAAVVGLDNLKGGGLAMMNLNSSDAEKFFGLAQNNFQSAESTFKSIGILTDFFARLLPPAKSAVDTTSSLIAIGKASSQIGNNLSIALGAWSDEDKNLGEKIGSLNEAVKDSLLSFQNIMEAVPNVDEKLLPPDQQGKFVQLRSNIYHTADSLKTLSESLDLAADAFARDKLHRYLVLFQNNSELRPTGGFIGSFALVDIIDGEIKNVEVPAGGSYDLQGALTENVNPPRPLMLLKNRWEFQDANWFPDFPSSAKKIIWFYNHSKGPTVDGVIAINAKVMEDLLSVVGPVSLDEYGKVLNQDNFMTEVQKSVELEYDKKENKPKQIISDLVPKIMEKITAADKDALVKIMAVFSEAGKSRDLQLYFTDPAMENRILALGLDGQIKETNGDYLMAVSANIAGQKTDRVIEENIYHNTEIKPSGIVIDTVKITRKHNGKKGDLFTGVRNNDYLRIYVPQGSVILSASGFNPPDDKLFKPVVPSYNIDHDLVEISGLADNRFNSSLDINEEFDKTVFGGWISVDPGETAEATIQYRLPNKIAFDSSPTNFVDWVQSFFNRSHEVMPYSLLVQKQSGAESKIFHNIIYPNNYGVFWQYPVATADPAVGEDLTADKMYGIIFQNFDSNK